VTTSASRLNTRPAISMHDTVGTRHRPARRSPLASPPLTALGTAPGTRPIILGETGTGVTGRR
jgi:hypothetical protein